MIELSIPGVLDPDSPVSLAEREQALQDLSPEDLFAFARRQGLPVDKTLTLYTEMGLGRQSAKAATHGPPPDRVETLLRAFQGSPQGLADDEIPALLGCDWIEATEARRELSQRGLVVWDQSANRRFLKALADEKEAA